MCVSATTGMYLTLGPTTVYSDGSSRQVKTNTPLLVGLCIPQANLKGLFHNHFRIPQPKAVSTGGSDDLFQEVRLLCSDSFYFWIPLGKTHEVKMPWASTPSPQRNVSKSLNNYFVLIS